MNSVASLSTLFASSFLAATVLPGGSEVVLYALLQQGLTTASTAVTVATVGNTLGGMTSYCIGRVMPPPNALRGVATLQRFGGAALLLSWVPFLGDALCIAAGWLRMKVVAATVFMAIGKFGRYSVIAAMAV
jgi:membrane protein YqaA with SNARE-associated domain